MNKSGVFLVIFILLLGIATVPTGPDFSAVQIEPSPTATSAALATTGTLKVLVAEDSGVLNGTYADTNFGADAKLYLGTADDGDWFAARSWFKFNLTHLPHELSVQRATMNVFIAEEWSGAAGVDEPVGAYYCDDNSWELMGITWNNQPTFSSTPTDVIDSPASPSMFLAGNWYSWEITPDVRTSLSTGEKILSEVLKYTEEIGTENSFWYPMKSETYPFNATYLEIEYTTPTVSDLTVDGIASGPPLDYINNPCAEFGWTFTDPDYQDFQKDYEVEVWNNTYYNDTLLWQKSHESVYTVHDSGSSDGNYHPFGQSNYNMFLQMKFPSTEIPKSGIVDKLYFNSPIAEGIAHLENLEIALVQVEGSADLTADFVANLEGRIQTIVLSRDSFDLEVVDGVVELDIEDTFFVYANLNLIIQFRMTNMTGTEISLRRTTTGGPGSAAGSWGMDSYYATTADYLSTRTYDLKLGYLTQTVYDLGASMNAFPFGVNVGTPGRFQIKFNRSYINRAGFLDKMYFPVSTFEDEVVYENFRISIVETPILGKIDHVNMEANYGGNTPTVVLDESMYTVRNLGNVLVIDFDNSYYYSNTNDLLIDFQWDSLVSGYAVVYYTPGYTSSYRSWNLTWGEYRYDNGTAGYNFLLDFVNSEDSTHLDSCMTPVEGERYYWRVRTCDSTGIWGDWTTANFKYETIAELPVISGVLAPESIEMNQEVVVDVNATHSLGIYRAYIEFDGTNHSMTGSAGEYSFAWTPSTVGNIDFTIYVHSNGNTWASFSDQVNVTAASTTGPTGPGTPVDMTMLLIIVGAAAVVIIIIVIVMKKKK